MNFITTPMLWILLLKWSLSLEILPTPKMVSKSFENEAFIRPKHLKFEFDNNECDTDFKSILSLFAHYKEKMRKLSTKNENASFLNSK